MASKKATQKETTKREILILVRYKIKKGYAPKGLHAGDVVFLVRNDKGKEYYTTLRKSHVHTCTCKARPGTCYHVAEAREIENARIEARKAAKVAQQPVVDKPTQPVVSPVVVKEEQHYTMSAGVYAKLASASAEQAVPVEEPAESPKDNVVDLGQRGSLNGNRGFQLMKSA